MTSQDYHTINATTLGVLLATCLLLPPLVLGLQPPCPMLALTGRPCMLCGCTRDFLLILRGQSPHWNPHSASFFALILGELTWRAILSIRPVSLRLLPWDILLHLPIALWLAYLWTAML